MSGTRRRRGHEEHEEHINHERWLVTYADTITLLMVLFIVLFAISQIDQKKFAALASGLASGFGQPQAVAPGSTSVLPMDASTHTLTDAAPVVSVDAIPRITQEVSLSSGQSTTSGQAVDPATAAAQQAAAQDARDLDRAEQLVSAALTKAGMRNRVVMRRDERGLTISVIVDDLVFPADSAALQDPAKRLLAVIAPALKETGHDIVVEGNTNTVAVHPKNYPSEWELSSARASSVVRYLISPLGLTPRSLSVVGYGDTRPLVPASDPRSITLNRRVAIVVLSSLTPDQQALLALHASTAGGASHG